jgi:hypothetical protein
MKKLLILGLGLALVFVWGCDTRITFSGIRKAFGKLAGRVKARVEQKSDLKYANTATLSAEWDSGLFRLREGVADVELAGQDRNTAELEVSYREYSPGDAVLSIQPWSGKEKAGKGNRKGSITWQTKSGRDILITSITGKLPQAVRLDLECGTGGFKLSGFEGAANLELRSGTGSIQVVGCGALSAKLETGTGDILADNCRIGALKAISGTGDIAIRGCVIEDAEFTAGTGDVDLQGSSITRRKFSSGTGTVTESKE